MITRYRIREIVDDLIEKREEDKKTNQLNQLSMNGLNDKFISELKGLKRKLCAL